ncbi:hypothetical protein CgunFtcFv8_006166 [Champsocephalus gunnari]|uniref:Uncharacterized protein n=1 Tax=Champsocephalus gunnari TaxID=52237 RepID=A0AAN8C187_CHAGU|nr:hypothetical protein CgunFtcFv8_006166 [Champsocephalus gunnari]
MGTAVGLRFRHFSDFPPVSGWSPGVAATRCWPAAEPLVWDTQSPDGPSPLDLSPALSGRETHQSIQDMFYLVLPDV